MVFGQVTKMYNHHQVSFRTFTAFHMHAPKALNTFKSWSFLSQKVSATFMPVFLPWCQFSVSFIPRHTHSKCHVTGRPTTEWWPSKPRLSMRRDLEAWSCEHLGSTGDLKSFRSKRGSRGWRNPGGAEETAPEWTPSTARDAGAPAQKEGCLPLCPPPRRESHHHPFPVLPPHSWGLQITRATKPVQSHLSKQ